MDKQTSYKKRTLFLLIITVAALVVCAASLRLKQNLSSVSAAPLSEKPKMSYTDYYSSNSAPSQENSREQAGSSENNFDGDAPQYYLITVYDGKIGVYENGKTASPPFLTADVNVYLLPDEDITLLKKGLRAETLSQVRAILEDYR